MGSASGSPMRTRSRPSAGTFRLGRGCEHRTNRVAVAQEASGARHHKLAGLDTVEHLDEAVGRKTRPDWARPDPVVDHDLQAWSLTPIDDSGERNRDAAATRDLDRAAREGADPQRRVIRKRDPDATEARRTIDLRE